MIRDRFHNDRVLVGKLTDVLEQNPVASPQTDQRGAGRLRRQIYQLLQLFRFEFLRFGKLQQNRQFSFGGFRIADRFIGEERIEIDFPPDLGE